MSWHEPDYQIHLWHAFMRYAQTHPQVLEQIPDEAYVILVPEYDFISEHEMVHDLLRTVGTLPPEQVAYVHLAFSDFYIPEDIPSLPPVADVRVEVLPPRMRSVGM